MLQCSANPVQPRHLLSAPLKSLILKSKNAPLSYLYTCGTFLAGKVFSTHAPCFAGHPVLFCWVRLYIITLIIIKLGFVCKPIVPLLPCVPFVSTICYQSIVGAAFSIFIHRFIVHIPMLPFTILIVIGYLVVLCSGVTIFPQN